MNAHAVLTGLVLANFALPLSLSTARAADRSATPAPAAAEIPPSTCALVTKWIATDRASNTDFMFTGLCSADVISSSHAVTAAHCFNRELKNGQYLKQMIEQSLYCASNGKTYPLRATFTVHPGYREEEAGRDFDVAVVQAASRFDVKPVELPKYSLETYLLARANACVLTGYRTNAEVTKFTAHAEPNPYFAGSKAIRKLSEHAVADKKAPLPVTKLFSFGEININPGDSGGGVSCKNLAGDWVRIATIDSIRLAGATRLVAFESTYADREFLLPYTDQKTAPAYAKAYYEDLRSRGDQVAEYEMEFQDHLKQWDDVWPLPAQTFAGLETPDDKDDRLTPLWDQMSSLIKLIGWHDFVN